jgi:hypothetical protein
MDTSWKTRLRRNALGRRHLVLPGVARGEQQQQQQKQVRGHDQEQQQEQKQG